MARKIKIAKNGQVTTDKNLLVICPMSMNKLHDDTNYDHKACDTNCAWFSIFENDAYCRTDKIGVIDEES